MGLNLDLDHVALSALRKFDGQNHRNLTPGEIAQIAGRAGRHMNDGTFGVTGGADPLDAELIERLENHNFEPIRTLQWRNRAMDFSTLFALRESLREIPAMARLARARMADDVFALEAIAGDTELAPLANSPAAVALLWDVCQIPDYRKISASNHAELVGTLYKSLRTGNERIDEDWFAKQVAFSDRTDGDIDTLSNRLAHIRTWTFVSNRANWLKDPAHWQARTREIEDKLSDALHECLTQRFVDRRTSALVKGMRDKDELTAEVADDGAIKVENHYVGRLKGFRFVHDAESVEGINQKAARAAATQAVSRELGMRSRRVAAAKADAMKLTRKGLVLWRNEEIAEVTASDDPLKPTVTLLVDDTIAAPDREKLQARLDAWVVEIIGDKLKSLVEISKAEDVTGLARGIAYRMKENFGILKRETVAEEIKSLDQTARAQLRKYGVRFGAFNVFFPALLKPAPADLALSLWCLKNANTNGLSRDALPEPPRPGLTSVATDQTIPEAFYRAAGYHVCGPRAVRLDILERLADLIRPLLAWRQNKEPNAAAGTPPRGSTGDGGFLVLPEMMSILGCSPDELSNVLKSLGFWPDRRIVKPVAIAPAPVAAAPAAEEALAASSESGTPSEIPAEVVATPVEPTAPAETATAVEMAPAPAETAPQVMDVPAASTPTEAAPEEPKYEDVWRPRRPNQRAQGERAERTPRPDRAPRDRSRYRKPPGATDAPAEAGATVVAADGSPAAAPTTGPDGAPRRDGDRGPRRDGDQGSRRERGRGRDGGRDNNRRPNAEGPTAKPADGAVAGAPEARKPNDDRGSGRPGDRRDDRRGSGPNRGGDRPRRDGDRPRRDGDRDQSRGPKVVSAAPSKKSADPDSPFAALSVLREQLANRSKEKNSN